MPPLIIEQPSLPSSDLHDERRHCWSLRTVWQTDWLSDWFETLCRLFRTVAQCRIWFIFLCVCFFALRTFELCARRPFGHPKEQLSGITDSSEIHLREADSHSHTHTHALKLNSLITHCQPLIYPNFLTNFDHYDGCAIKIKIHAVSVSVLALLPPCLSLCFAVSL